MWPCDTSLVAICTPLLGDFSLGMVVGVPLLLIHGEDFAVIGGHM